MLRFITADRLVDHPRLADSMFRDRAAQFRDRLGWEVTVDARGHERDAYDECGPIYAIWQRPDGLHGGSMRFLPTTGPVMVNDHFAHLTDQPLSAPDLWECTRFCLAPGAGPAISAALMQGAVTTGLGVGARRLVGVFDARMVRIYRRLAWQPKVLASCGSGRQAISLGLWQVMPQVPHALARPSGVAPDLARHWWLRGGLGGAGCDGRTGPALAQGNVSALAPASGARAA